MINPKEDLNKRRTIFYKKMMNKKYFILGLIFIFLFGIILLVDMNLIFADYLNQTDGFSVSSMSAYSGYSKYNGTYFVFSDASDKVFVINNSGSHINNFSIPDEGDYRQSLAFNGSNIFYAMGGMLYNYNISGTLLNNFTIQSNTLEDYQNYGGLYTLNGSDFWLLTGQSAFIQHFNFSGANLTDGFSIKNATELNVFADFTMNGSEVFLTSNPQDFVYHLSNGVNQSDGFSLTSLGITSGSGIATNDSKNLWIMDNQDLFIYHLLSNITADILGHSQSSSIVPTSVNKNTKSEINLSVKNNASSTYSIN